MVLDGHIHLMQYTTPLPGLLGNMSAGGFDGGVLLSLPPAAFPEIAPPCPADARLEHVLAWCAGSPELFPFFWIDPLEEDALAQVELACGRGIAGFKVICDRYFPSDERALVVFRAIARVGKPILFHSGILWDGKPSSRYNRPVEFEALLEVPGLRFAMAHISWPWTDELLAVYGKFADALRRRPELGVELFIDLTPGTPVVYRYEALRKLLTIGYDLKRNVFIGSDSILPDSDPAGMREWLAGERRLFRQLRLSEEDEVAFLGGNLRRFLGLEKMPE